MTFPFALDPLPHQLREWERSRSERARAIFWEQGLGKSKLTIDTAYYLWAVEQKIDCVIVVAPNGVHRNWVDEELPLHVPELWREHSRAFAYQSERADTKWHARALDTLPEFKGLVWFTLSYDAFLTKRGKDILIQLLDRRKVLFILDESQNIKTPTAERTKTILKAGLYADCKRILSGTPIAIGPFDMYSQIKFLNADFWKKHNLGSFTEYKQHFGVWRKEWMSNLRSLAPNQQDRQVDMLVEYRRLDELQRIIEPIMARLLKENVLKLPPKNYSKIEFDLSPEQQAMYDSMSEESLAWLNADGKAGFDLFGQIVNSGECVLCGGTGELFDQGYIYQCDCKTMPSLSPDSLVIADGALVKLLRLQQIVCGYLPTEKDEEPIHIIPGKQPRLEALRKIIQDRPGRKMIIWSRFTHDIDQILALAKELKIKAVRYDGKVDDQGRAESKALFQGMRLIPGQVGEIARREPVPSTEQAQLFVANSAAGATGLTLTAAKTNVYYSNSFKLIDRLQSEDRSHRIGQEDEVEYIDLMARNTIDYRLIESLRAKFGIAGKILGDEYRTWI